ATRAGVARLRPVVAHHEVVARWDVPDLPEVGGVGQPSLRRDVRLLELHELLRPRCANPDEAAVVLAHGLAGEADDPLHERAALAALERCRPGSVEDDDVATRRRAEVETDTAGEHAIAGAPEAARLRRPARTVQRRLHRGRRDAVRVDDP